MGLLLARLFAACPEAELQVSGGAEPMVGLMLLIILGVLLASGALFVLGGCRGRQTRSLALRRSSSSGY